MDVTQLALTWVGWPNGEKLDSRANLILTKVSARNRKSTQVHASSGQTESQVYPSFQLASTCDSVWTGSTFPVSWVMPLVDVPVFHKALSVFFVLSNPSLFFIQVTMIDFSSDGMVFQFELEDKYPVSRGRISIFLCSQGRRQGGVAVSYA